MLFETPQDLEPAWVERILWHLLEHHDALRTYFVRAGSTWQAFIANHRQEVPFIYIDMSNLLAAEHGTAIEQASTELHGSFNLSEEPLLRVALFRLSVRGPNRLLVTVHHLVADAASMAILMEDFQVA
jgi:NRPS condensation-like uncharacterized protein